MSRVTLYIADMDSQFASRVRGALARNPSIAVTGCAEDGKRALTEIRRLSPDVLLTDLSLPGLDGIALLRESRRLPHPPAVIVCTRFCSEASMECSCRYGASFFLCKPIDPDGLPNLILECRRNAQRIPEALQDAREEDAALSRRAAVARALLNSLGMPARLIGSACVIEAVTRFQGDRLLFRNLSNGLYTRLADSMSSTVPRIERALRSAIAVAYDRGTLGRHFPRRPTNRQFLEFVLCEVDAAQAEAQSTSLSVSHTKF